MSLPAVPLSFDGWLLDPRDPLVFGDGGQVPALMPRSTFLLPPQATVAGLVRTTVLEAAGDLSPEAARESLQVRIRGPWLQETYPGPGDGPTLWAPAPADAALAEGQLIRPQLVRLQADEGVGWPSGAPRSLDLVYRPPRDQGGRKTEPLPFPLWPFDALVRWGLGECPTTSLEEKGLLSRQTLPPIAPEHRLHLAIDPITQTALPEALFSSGGLRYAECYRLAVEVHDGRSGMPRQAAVSADPRLRVLGGESRTVSCTGGYGPILPSFEEYEASLTQHASTLEASGRLGLRLQLLSPGCFGGWQPRWPSELEGHLRAVCLDRHLAVSGWDLQRGRPRAVRRLVPAGSVYFLGPFSSADRVLDRCRQLWGQSLCEEQPGDPDSFLAPPAHDGYGTVLPLPCELHWEEP